MSKFDHEGTDNDDIFAITADQQAVFHNALNLEVAYFSTYLTSLWLSHCDRETFKEVW